MHSENLETLHIPVMVDEVMEALKCSKDKIYVDGTVGCGGHTLEILKRTAPTGKVIGIDCDEDALNVARERLKAYEKRVTFVYGNFSEIKEILKGLRVFYVHGILLDLGISSLQLGRSDRGFSFMNEGGLDMRMDREKEETAFRIVNFQSEEELKEIIKKYGEERWASRIAKKIVQRRNVKPIETTVDLSGIVFAAIPRKYHSKRIHPATKTFQSIRIAVNNELQKLEQALKDGMDSLKTGGRFCVITYHSLEDRIVKKLFKTYAQGCVCPPYFPKCVCGQSPRAKIITKKPVRPHEVEVRNNPRSRSAKLRVAENIALH